jgi:hypothetical protein
MQTVSCCWTQENLSWFSLHHEDKQGGCFVPLVVVALMKKEKTILGTSRQHCEFIAHRIKCRWKMLVFLQNVSPLSGLRASSFAKVNENGEQLVQKRGFRLKRTPPSPLLRMSLHSTYPHDSVPNEIKVSGNRSAQFRVPTVAQQSFHVSLCMTSNSKRHFYMKP